MSRRLIVAVFAPTLWISFSEFFRNEILLKSYWTEHYEKLGLEFPSEPVNGVVWIVWSLMLAAVITFLLRETTLRKTLVITWVMAFLMMWVVIGNLSVLPTILLAFAIPLSVIEIYVAARIIQYVDQAE